MTVSTTTDAPVDLDVDLRLLPFAIPSSELDAEGLRDAGAGGGEVALNHEAETVACLLPVKAEFSDVEMAQGLVEGFVLGTYRYRRYKTADGFDGPSAFLVHVGEDYESASVEEGVERGRHVAGFW